MEKKKILVVDDEKGFTDMVKEILEETGEYEVDVENDAKMALIAVKRTQPDLILLDVLLPYMDGPHIAEMIRDDGTIKDVPIVFVSGLFDFVSDDTKPSCILLSKPLQVKKLIQCVEDNL
ncbi:MAG: response regulator [Candidatus Omnitrophota bacterium]